MVDPSLLLLAVALLRLVVAPRLNTRETPARGALPFFSDLLDGRAQPGEGDTTLFYCFASDAPDGGAETAVRIDPFEP